MTSRASRSSCLIFDQNRSKSSGSVGKAGAEIDLAAMEIGPAAPTAISIDRRRQFLKAPLEQRNRIVRQAAPVQLHHKRTELIDAGPRSHHWSPEQLSPEQFTSIFKIMALPGRGVATGARTGRCGSGQHSRK